jgi:hypothetical protein
MHYIYARIKKQIKLRWNNVKFYGGFENNKRRLSMYGYTHKDSRFSHHSLFIPSHIVFLRKCQALDFLFSSSLSFHACFSALIHKVFVHKIYDGVIIWLFFELNERRRRNGENKIRRECSYKKSNIKKE